MKSKYQLGLQFLLGLKILCLSSLVFERMYFLAGVKTEISGFLLAIGHGLSQLLGAAYMPLDPIDNSLHGCLLSSKLARVCL